MAYTNSPLVNYTKISPNRTPNRNHAIDTITIHCVVGQCTVESLGNVFAPTSRKASSNYGVGKDGRIGMYCEEKDRSWCSSSAANDHRAVTIEVASDTKEPYAVNEAAYNALISLVADICKRNKITRLVWSNSKDERAGHKNGCNMTVHRDFAATSCPGSYLYGHMADIAAKVNAKLAPAPEQPKPQQPQQPAASFAPGDLVKITGTTYYNGGTIPDWVKSKNWIVKSVSGDRVVIDKSEDGKNAVNSPVNAAELALIRKGVQTPGNTQTALKTGDTVKLKAGATKYSNGVPIPGWVKKAILFVRAVEQGGKVLLVSTEKTKEVYTGRVNAADVQKV